MQGLQIPPLIIMWDTTVSCNTPLNHKHNIFSLVYIFSILISSWVCEVCKEFGFSSQYWAHKSIRHQRLEAVRISWMQGGSSPWPLYKQISYQWHQEVIKMIFLKYACLNSNNFYFTMNSNWLVKIKDYCQCQWRVVSSISSGHQLLCLVYHCHCNVLYITHLTHAWRLQI